MIYIPSLNPYSVSILSHGCIVTLLVVCCVGTILCSEITRFCAQLRPVQNYTFLKDLHPYVSSNFHEQAVLASAWISIILADPGPQASHL